MDNLEDMVEDPIVGLTEKAAEMVKYACDQEQKPYGLRLLVQGGGCAGFIQKLDFEEEARDGDHVFEQYGIKIYIDSISAMHLEGTTIDYVSLGVNGGFKFINPNATRTCGCGLSYST